ncbi:MAG: response regulator transcription factor [Betaproteobacteria bacterium]
MTPTASLTERIPIIICEDDEELRSILVVGLRYFGIDACGVGDGVALDTALAADRATVVVLDIGLPGEDGLAITRRLSASRPSVVGIILLTARGAVDDRIEGIRSGADAYFVKPVDLRELASAVQNLHRQLR